MSSPLAPAEERLMRMTIDLAVENARSGQGGPFAAMIARASEVIATGVNLVTSTNDPTAHAEMVAIRKACATLGTFQLAACDLYTSCEPCPMCYSTAYWARVSKIYYAAAWTDYSDLFDDSNISMDMKKPYAERAIPVAPLIRNEAQKVWLEFRKIPDRAKY